MKRILTDLLAGFAIGVMVFLILYTFFIASVE